MKKNMTDTLRQAIKESGVPFLQIANATGLDPRSLSRFASGKRSLRLDLADRLAAHFGFEIRQTKPPTKGT